MFAENDPIVTDCPDFLRQVDVVKTKFLIVFSTPCSLRPSDFLALGRTLRLIGRDLFGEVDGTAPLRWKALFQPQVSTDPVLRRKFQKPAPAFVVTMPIMDQTSFAAEETLELEVLFIGNGIPLIGDFLRCLSHLGHLGMVAGAGRFTVAAVYSQDSAASQKLLWRQDEPLDSLACPVKSLDWLLEEKRLVAPVVLSFQTPVRLMVAGRPLRKPSFSQIFPFMLRRVTAMISTHSHIELTEGPAELLAAARALTVTAHDLEWRDWRALSGHKDLVVGGFVGDISLFGQPLAKLYWVLAAASLLNIGKGATYGAGHYTLEP